MRTGATGTVAGATVDETHDDELRAALTIGDPYGVVDICTTRAITGVFLDGCVKNSRPQRDLEPYPRNAAPSSLNPDLHRQLGRARFLVSVEALEGRGSRSSTSWSEVLARLAQEMSGRDYRRFPVP